ncbi:hypothetical protein [Streptomyces sp. NPDC002343]
MDGIAAPAGPHRRGVFRCFATEEDIVPGGFGLVRDALPAASRARPADDPAWTSPHRAFDALAARATTRRGRQCRGRGVLHP